MMRKRWFGAALLLGAFALTGCAGGSTETREVRIAAASDLTFAMDAIAELVADVDPTIRLRPAFGSSGQFLQQIVNGAPFDLYLSADRTFPADLVERGLADETDFFDYAEGRLVVWSTRTDVAEPTLRTLAEPRVRTVAIANPRHAPYGRAADQAIVNAGIAVPVAPKLVLGENVAQAAEFVLSGSADIGVVALSMVSGPPVPGTWTMVPADAHAPLTQAGVILQRATDHEAARIVRDVLLSRDGQAVLRRFGFEPASP